MCQLDIGEKRKWERSWYQCINNVENAYKNCFKQFSIYMYRKGKIYIFLTTLVWSTFTWQREATFSSACAMGCSVKVAKGMSVDQGFQRFKNEGLGRLSHWTRIPVPSLLHTRTHTHLVILLSCTIILPNSHLFLMFVV